MKQRVLTALVAIPLVLGASFYSHPLPFAGLAILAAVLASVEFGRLAGRQFVPILGILVLLTFAQGRWRIPLSEAQVFPLLLVLWILGIAGARMAVQKRAWLAAELGSLWYAAPLLALMLLHKGAWLSAQDWNWRTPLLMVMLPLWAGDTAAIFAGKAFGRRLLAPTISPKKTVEGAVANALAAILVAALVGLLLEIHIGVAIVSGAIVAVLGQAGDLFQSQLKRIAGVKDSGALLPGHGGILDRIDSLLAVSIPIAWLLLLFQGQR